MIGFLALLVGGFGIDVRNTELYVLWAWLSSLLVASVAARVLYDVTGALEAEVTLPRRVLVGEDVLFAVTLRNRGARSLHALRVSGPFLPWDGRWTGSWPGVRRIQPGETARVELRARFVSRGEHHLDPFHAAALVPLGLAQGRAVVTGGARFLVLPRIARVVTLTLQERAGAEPRGGSLASKTGDSMEILGVRPYRPGDPVRHLHARSWARTGRPIVREYQEELLRRVAVVLDIDAGDERCAEAAVSLAAGVLEHLSRGDALVDLRVAGARVHELTLGRGLGFLEQALELLACFAPQPSLTGRGQTVSAAPLLARLEADLPRLSWVVVVEAGDRAPALAPRVRAAGVGCTWLRVERGAPARGGITGAADGAIRLDPEAIARGEELAI
jgi:uncharacterized protein (DUF58 family)